MFNAMNAATVSYKFGQILNFKMSHKLFRK